MDLVEKNGDKIDVDALAKRLGCPVVPTSALKGRGMEEVVRAAIEAGKKCAAPATTLRFTNEVEEALAQVIDVAGAAIKGRHARWYAIKLLEGEQDVYKRQEYGRESRKEGGAHGSHSAARGWATRCARFFK